MLQILTALLPGVAIGMALSSLLHRADANFDSSNILTLTGDSRNEEAAEATISFR